MSKDIALQNEYKSWADFIADKIKCAQTNAAAKVNTELLTLYWEIGNSIIAKQKQNGWGSKVIELLATDLSETFPVNTGFSVRNLKYMRAFAEAYPQFPIVQVPLAQSENKLKTPADEPTIGLLLCASKSNVKVEYAMRGLDKPLGVAIYQLEQLVKENMDMLNNKTADQ